MSSLVPRIGWSPVKEVKEKMPPRVVYCLVCLDDVIYRCLFELFLGTKLVRVSTLLLTAIGGLGWETGVALAANGLFAVVALGQKRETGVVHSST
mmetsp:Transcript_16581/g.30173  ORF Transcript_16581/g.30173 Transcript_16581/m.30173 type:complete len:95 (+) Transcript_16581:146-430(+)